MIPLVKSVMGDLMPTTAELPGVLDTDLDAFLRRFRRDSPTLMWVGVLAGCLLYTVTPILTVGLPLPSFLLPAARREQHAQRITTTRIYLLRQAMFLVKMVAGICWGQDPDVRARMGLAPYPQDPGTWRRA